MDRLAFERMLRLEQQHWWFVARRNIASAIISSIKLKPDSTILDAGCGSGGNLEMLSQFGNVYGFELDDEARRHARSRQIGIVEPGSLPDAIPFESVAFDFIVMADVLEHIKDDRAALAALYPRIKNGGYLLLMVPMFQSLWTSHDELHHHFRRYNRKELFQKTRDAGFDIVFSSYSYFALFPCLIVAFILEKLGIIAARKIGAQMPGRLLNHFLAIIFSMEARFMAKRLPLPIGISHVVLLRKGSS
jgi:SAM-dependent methyltransferase